MVGWIVRGLVLILMHIIGTSMNAAAYVVATIQPITGI